MSIEEYILQIIAQCRAADGADHNGTLPSTVLKEMAATLPPSSSWIEYTAQNWPPADILLDVVLRDTSGNRTIARNVKVAYPRGIGAPVFFRADSHAAVELYGLVVTHFAVTLAELPAVVVNEI